MTFALVDRWNEPGAPVVRQAEIRRTFDEYFESVAEFGITRSNYLIAARHAVVACRRMIEETIERSRAEEVKRLAELADEAERIAREHPGEREQARAELARKRVAWAKERYKALKEDGQRPRWSTILGTVRTVLNEYGRKGWSLFWSTLRTLEDVFGTAERATWERLRLLRETGWLIEWQRFEKRDHVYREGRSSIRFLRVPLEVWAAWIRTDEAPRVLASLEDEEAEPAAPRSSASSSAYRSRGRGTDAAPVGPPSAPPSSPIEAPRSTPGAPSWFRELFVTMRAKRYTSDPGKITSDNLRAIERLLEGAAATAYNELKKAGHTEESLPRMVVVRDEIAQRAIQAYFADRGRKDFLIEQQHPIGPFRGDAEKLSAVHGERWRVDYAEAHPLPPMRTVQMEASRSFAAAPPPAAPPAEPPASEGARSEAPRLARPASGVAIAPAFAAFQRRALSVASAARIADPDGDFDTLTSAGVDPPPD